MAADMCGAERHLVLGRAAQRIQVGAVRVTAVNQLLQRRSRLGGQEERRFAIQRLGMMNGDILRGPEGADLGGIQRGAAGAVHAEVAGRFTGDIQAMKVGFPVRVHGNAAVMMLGADRYAQWFGVQINVVVFVQIDGQRIHMRQTGNRRILRCAGVQQIVRRLPAQTVQPLFQPHGIGAEVHINLPAEGHCFMMNDNIDNGGALDLIDVEGPLIALQENVVQRLLGGVEIIRQELMLAALFINGNIARQHLLIGTGYVPAKIGGGQTILPLRQVGALRAGPQGHSAHAALAGRINRRFVAAGRAAGRQNDTGRQNQTDTVARLVRAGLIPAEEAVDPSLLHQQLRNQKTIHQADALGVNGALQAFRHELGGQRAGRGRALARIVVGLVAGIFAVLIGRKANAELAELHESPHGAGRFGQGGIAVDALAVKEVFRHFLHGIGIAGQG